MIGRIELVTSEQRALLQKIAKGPSPKLNGFIGPLQNAVQKIKNPELTRKLSEGKASISSLGIPIPDIYQAYLDLQYSMDIETSPT